MQSPLKRPTAPPCSGTSITSSLGDDELLLCVHLVADVFAPQHLVALSRTCTQLNKLAEPARADLRAVRELFVTVHNEQCSNDARVASACAILTTSTLTQQQVEFLQQPHAQQQQRKLKLHAAAAVAKLASRSSPHSDANKEALARAGALPAVVALLRFPPFARGAAIADEQQVVVAAIANLANGKDANRVALVDAGALPPLIAMTADARVPSVQHLATAALGNLAVHRDNKRRIAQAGALAPLLKLLQSDAPRRVTAAELLRSLARHEEVREQLVALGCPRRVERNGAAASAPEPKAEWCDHHAPSREAQSVC